MLTRRPGPIPTTSGERSGFRQGVQHLVVSKFVKVRVSAASSFTLRADKLIE
jgi:hypothetical protein